MNNNDSVRKYFAQNSDAWISDAYEQSGYNYPTPLHRVRIVKDILHSLGDVTRILDIGCGGGQLAFALAADGFEVLGIDQSAEMLERAQRELEGQSEPVRNRVRFAERSLSELTSEGHDAVTAMGLIGYLSEDAALFSGASRLLRDRGYLLVSFRNHLFNLFSISQRTLRDCENGHLAALINEADDLYQKLDVNCVRTFIEQLHSITGALLNDSSAFIGTSEMPSAQKGQHYVSEFEARQTTPAAASEAARQNGFETLLLRGVHPHFAVPGLNMLLPPQVYNKLSDSLIPLEQCPVSLLWSSVFVGVFQRAR